MYREVYIATLKVMYMHKNKESQKDSLLIRDCYFLIKSNPFCNAK